MSEEKKKTLCAHVEEELQVKDPQAYIALIQPATHSTARVAAEVRQRPKMSASRRNCLKTPQECFLH